MIFLLRCAEKTWIYNLRRAFSSYFSSHLPLNLSLWMSTHTQDFHFTFVHPATLEEEFRTTQVLWVTFETITPNERSIFKLKKYGWDGLTLKALDSIKEQPIKAGVILFHFEKFLKKWHLDCMGLWIMKYITSCPQKNIHRSKDCLNTVLFQWWLTFAYRPFSLCVILSFLKTFCHLRCLKNICMSSFFSCHLLLISK